MPYPRSLIAALPDTERPRERLLAQGSGTLSDAELLAVLLRTGRSGVSVLELADDLLSGEGGLAGLLESTPGSLRRSGIGPAKAASLLASFEIARRLARSDVSDREPLSDPARVAHYLALRYRQKDQEVMGALFLDGRRRLLGDREIFRGSLQRITVETREVLKECLVRGAAAFVLFHTHPSGDPAPSAEDLAFTRRMADAAEQLGIEMVDHLVLGRGRWVSLKARGAW
jgi:DNA repair protein RadC